MKMPTKPKAKLDPPVSSMGDIAFLLLIFFILVTVISKESSIKWEPPKAEELTDPKVKTTVSVSIDRDGQLYCMQKEVVNNNRSNFKDILEAELKNAYKDDQDKYVAVRIDTNTPYEVFEPILGIISGLGARMILYGDEGLPEGAERPKK